MILAGVQPYVKAESEPNATVALPLFSAVIVLSRGQMALGQHADQGPQGLLLGGSHLSVSHSLLSSRWPGNVAMGHQCLEQDFVLLQAKQAPPQLALHITLQLKRWVWSVQSLRRHAGPLRPGRDGVQADPPFASEELLHQAAFQGSKMRLPGPQ